MPGTTTEYAFGDRLPMNGAFNTEKFQAAFGSSEPMQPVGHYNPNAFGLYDMHGNVSEFVADAWHPNYFGAPTDGSVWPGGDETRPIARGGSHRDDYAFYLRSSSRSSPSRFGRMIYGDETGFRVARNL